MRNWFPGVGLLFSAMLAVGCSTETRISEMDPPQGTFAGGEEVMVKGNGFRPGHGGVVVKFGKRDATNIAVESEHSIKVTSPPGERNTEVDITVIFDDGRAYQLPKGFRYLEPTDNAKVMKTFSTKSK